jgi:hypothetical protein
MAHFARLDENNIVTEVIVISNDDLLDENGVEQEALGVAVCEQVAGAGPWIQTSYNGNFRKKYAAIGDTYQPDAEVFYSTISPYPSWSLDENYDWKAPVPYPTDGQEYSWDEENLQWVVAVEEPRTIEIFDGTTTRIVTLP